MKSFFQVFERKLKISEIPGKLISNSFWTFSVGRKMTLNIRYELAQWEKTYACQWDNVYWVPMIPKKKKKKNIPSLEFCMKVPNGSLEKVVRVVGADFWPGRFGATFYAQKRCFYSFLIFTTLEKSHRTIGEKYDFTNSWRDKNHIMTRFSSWWVSPLASITSGVSLALYSFRLWMNCSNACDGSGR